MKMWKYNSRWMRELPRRQVASIQECFSEGKPGYRYGNEGFCYTYTPGDEKSRKAAKFKAYLQRLAIIRQTGEKFFINIVPPFANEKGE